MSFFLDHVGSMLPWIFTASRSHVGLAQTAARVSFPKGSSERASSLASSFWMDFRLLSIMTRTRATALSSCWTST